MYTSVNNYLTNQVLNASPLELVIMLYGKAISSLKLAKTLMGSGKKDVDTIKKKAESIGKAIEILTYLQATLDKEKGKEIAKNLDEIYEVLINELIRAQLNEDIKIVEDSIAILSNLKKAWEEINKNKDVARDAKQYQFERAAP